MNKKLLSTVLLSALIVTGCSSAKTNEGDAPGAENQSAAPVVLDETNVSTVLNALTVADEQGGDTYDREEFNHWVQSNDTGCDTRFAVLVEESTAPAQTDGCKVTSGNWVSVYDGKTVTDPGELDIDHMVPLKEAWVSGAYEWDAETREAYANDLSYSNSLVAVTASSNRSKSDGDPTDWMPTADNAHCDYVAHWVTVKSRWNLKVDAAEKKTILDILPSCDSDMKVGEAPGTATEPTTGDTPTPEAPVPASPVAPVPEEAAPPAAAAPVAGATDPDMGSCSAAKEAGYGPYTKGQPEYEFYRDGDNDGTVCD